MLGKECLMFFLISISQNHLLKERKYTMLVDKNVKCFFFKF